MRKLLAFTLALVSPLILGGCSQRPRLDVTATVENGDVVFHIPHKGINGILELRVADASDKQHWIVETSYDKDCKFIYGMLPTGGNQPAVQVFPPENLPPTNIRGMTVLVEVTYQYDKWWATVTSDTFSKAIEIPK
jgi:hypothetical protein